MKKAGIIGSGVAGIATAIRLAVKGYDVTVFEKNSYAGGKLSEIKIDSFRFDAGPSLLTLPELIIELFTLAKKNYQDYIQFIRLDSTCKYFYPDGTEIIAYSNREKFAEELEKKTKDSKEHVLKFLDNSKEIYDITANIFLFNSLHIPANFFNIETLKGIANIGKVDVFRKMNTVNQHLFKDEKTIQLFNRYATYNGSNPYQAPATLNVISHLEHNLGAYIAKGGMYSVVKALLKLSEEVGVKIKYNSDIQEIITENDQAKGLRVNDEIVDFDIIVTNSDIINTYKYLLPKYETPKSLLKQEGSSSALIFYWSINKTFPELDLHNIIFSDNYKKEFDYIFTEKEIYKDPTVYIYISSKYNSEDAPKGKENWFVMINTPYNNGQDWNKLVNQAKNNIIKKINKTLNTDIEKHIINQDILTPQLIETKTSSYRGSLYGNSSNSKFSAFLRHPNFSNKIKNLYFCGGSVHPGGGIPLSLASAKIIDKIIKPA